MSVVYARRTYFVTPLNSATFTRVPTTTTCMTSRQPLRGPVAMDCPEGEPSSLLTKEAWCQESKWDHRDVHDR
uniref:SRCR domain-containing protein n=1 Tax=Panagrellus redivivus TaxID=6233 RepID=A0A7E5A1K7_PANRE